MFFVEKKNKFPYLTFVCFMFFPSKSKIPNTYFITIEKKI